MFPKRPFVIVAGLVLSLAAVGAGVWLLRKDGTVATPQPVEQSLLDASVKTCESRSVLGPYVPVLAERRGNLVTLLLGKSAAAVDTICILDVSGQLLKIGTVGMDLPAAGEFLKIEYLDTLGGHHSGGTGTRICAGRARPPAASVTFDLKGGRTAVATVANGWFLTSWNRYDPVADEGAIVMDPAGIELEHIAEPVCLYRPSNSAGGSKGFTNLLR